MTRSQIKLLPGHSYHISNWRHSTKVTKLNFRMPKIAMPSIHQVNFHSFIDLIHAMTVYSRFSLFSSIRSFVRLTDIVPIAVGCALIALVVVVLIAYLVGRRRAQSRGYISM